MRRWTLTLFLAATAAAATLVAPRLLGSPVDEAIPPPPPEEFWRDMVDCGMG